MAEFILFVRGGNDAYPSMSPEEIQQAIARYSQWARDLESQGKLVDAFKLKDDGGRALSLRNGKLIVDGPLPETKETIGGYYHIRADDYDSAIKLAKMCPVFSDGGTLEIRQIEG
jgi:hypothetical protein